jgi:hypothetical protein
MCLSSLILPFALRAQAKDAIRQMQCEFDFSPIFFFFIKSRHMMLD